MCSPGEASWLWAARCRCSTSRVVLAIGTLVNPLVCLSSTHCRCRAHGCGCPHAGSGRTRPMWPTTTRTKTSTPACRRPSSRGSRRAGRQPQHPAAGCGTGTRRLRRRTRPRCGGGGGSASLGQPGPCLPGSRDPCVQGFRGLYQCSRARGGRGLRRAAGSAWRPRKEGRVHVLRRRAAFSWRLSGSPPVRGCVCACGPRLQRTRRQRRRHRRPSTCSSAAWPSRWVLAVARGRAGCAPSRWWLASSRTWGGMPVNVARPCPCAQAAARSIDHSTERSAVVCQRSVYRCRPLVDARGPPPQDPTPPIAMPESHASFLAQVG